jgi:hypothetical protein
MSEEQERDASQSESRLQHQQEQFCKKLSFLKRPSHIFYKVLNSFYVLIFFDKCLKGIQVVSLSPYPNSGYFLQQLENNNSKTNAYNKN